MDRKDVFKDFVGKNEVLIVDKNPSSRNRLFKIMLDLGANRLMTHTAGSLADAENIIKTKKIGIVLADYYVGGGSGFDLFKIIREKFSGNKNLCLILVTSNISQTAVAKAAEEDVDSFIIKPFTVQSIQENLIATITDKIQPSDYLIKVEEGKVLISAKKYAEALEVLQAASQLHPKPALALFYMGQAEYLLKRADVAQDAYQQGLAFNNIHYKCLVGLYEILIKDDQFEEAYQVVKKLARYFPANPDRLTEIVRLSIKTKNFKDMQFYYETFTSLEERSPHLINYIGAGMFVSGKHCLLNNDLTTAMQFFENIIVSCSDFTKFTRAIITLLVLSKNGEKAEKFLRRFPPSLKDKEDYLVSEFLFSSATANDPNFVVKGGLQLYNRKIKDYDCMSIMLLAMEKCGYKDEKLLPFQKEMQALWPEKVAA